MKKNKQRIELHSCLSIKKVAPKIGNMGKFNKKGYAGLGIGWVNKFYNFTIALRRVVGFLHCELSEIKGYALTGAEIVCLHTTEK